jgi:hypothetical protein
MTRVVRSATQSPQSVDAGGVAMRGRGFDSFCLDSN